MPSSRRRKSTRVRVGRVSYYQHHGSWYVYYREGQRPVRRRIEGDERAAEQVAAQVNAELSTAAPTMFSYTPVGFAELCRLFLDHHEFVLRSSVATVQRYRTALRHLEDFAAQLPANTKAHEIEAAPFARHLRRIKVAPNGHPNSARRPLRDKGVRYILEVCRSLYGFAAKRRLLPPYFENPFAGLGSKRLAIEDAKQVFVFDAESEYAFLAAADGWSFPIHFTLATTGLRSGELVHLLIEDLDLDGGWLHVRNKPELGWKVKTRRERAIPLAPELIAVLRRVVGSRTAGPVFLRPQFQSDGKPLAGAAREAFARRLGERISDLETQRGESLPRETKAAVAREAWREAGAVKADQVRLSFIHIAHSIGLSTATCPKSWRHTFATLLQDANVDPLVRQITLGHAPTTPGLGDLGMTTVYTHTRSETQRREILRALRFWPKSLELARQRLGETWEGSVPVDEAGGDILS